MAQKRIEVPVANLSAALARIEQVRKRAARTGVAFAEPQVDVARWCRYAPKGAQTSADAARNVWTAVTIEVDAPEVRFDGWRLAGVVERIGTEALVREVPGEDVPAAHRTTPERCDHCGTRRARRETFVLRHEDGRTTQVGRQCIADFLGGQSVESIINWATFLTSLDGLGDEDDDDARWHDFPAGATALDVLTTAAQVIRVDGHYRKADSTSGSTAATIQRLYFPARSGKAAEDDARLAEKYGPFTEADAAEAMRVLGWMHGLPADGTYLGNLGVLARQGGLIETRHWGLLASAPAAYARAMGQIAERAARAEERAAAAPVPTGKVCIEAEVVSIREIDGDYGLQHKMMLRGEGGWRLYGTVPGALVGALQVGQRVRFSATIEAARDDATMGFYKRPTKAEVV